MAVLEPIPRVERARAIRPVAVGTAVAGGDGFAARAVPVRRRRARVLSAWTARACVPRSPNRR